MLALYRSYKTAARRERRAGVAPRRRGAGRHRALAASHRGGQRPHPGAHEPLPRAGEAAEELWRKAELEPEELYAAWCATSKSTTACRCGSRAAGTSATHAALRAGPQAAHPVRAAAHAQPHVPARAPGRRCSRCIPASIRILADSHLTTDESRAAGQRGPRQLLRGRGAHAVRALPRGLPEGALRHRRPRPPLPRRLRAGVPPPHDAAAPAGRGRAVPHDPHRRRRQHLQALQRERAFASRASAAPARDGTSSRPS